MLLVVVVDVSVVESPGNGSLGSIGSIQADSTKTGSVGLIFFSSMGLGALDQAVLSYISNSVWMHLSQSSSSTVTLPS